MEIDDLESTSNSVHKSPPKKRRRVKKKKRNEEDEECKLVFIIKIFFLHFDLQTKRTKIWPLK